MAAENLMLEAVGRGLGTCVIKSFHPQIVKKILSLPEQIYPEFLVTLGYPNQEPKMPRRRPVRWNVLMTPAPMERSGFWRRRSR